MLMLLPLHGVIGYWDELVCLAIPFTVILGIGWAVLRGGHGAPKTIGERDLPKTVADEPIAIPGNPTTAGHEE